MDIQAKYRRYHCYTFVYPPDFFQISCQIRLEFSFTYIRYTLKYMMLFPIRYKMNPYLNYLKCISLLKLIFGFQKREKEVILLKIRS